MKWIQRKPQFKRESEGYQTQLQFTNTMSQCEGYWSIQNNSDVSGTSNTTTPQSKYFKRSSQQWIILPINNEQWLVMSSIPYIMKCFYFHCLGTLLILKSLYIGAVSMKSLLPSLDVDSCFHAGPINHDAATPPTNPPNWNIIC